MFICAMFFLSTKSIVSFLFCYVFCHEYVESFALAVAFRSEQMPPKVLKCISLEVKNLFYRLMNIFCTVINCSYP